MQSILPETLVLVFSPLWPAGGWKFSRKSPNQTHIFVLYLTYHSLVITFFSFQFYRMRQGWFLVPIFAPFLGTIVGTMIYQLMVGFHVEGEVRDRKEEEERNVRLTNVSSKEENKDTY